MKRSYEIPETEWPLRARVAKWVFGCTVEPWYDTRDGHKGFRCVCKTGRFGPPHGETHPRCEYADIVDYTGDRVVDILDRSDLRVDLRTDPRGSSCSIYASETGDEDGDPDSGYGDSMPTWQEAVCEAAVRAMQAVKARECSEPQRERCASWPQCAGTCECHRTGWISVGES